MKKTKAKKSDFFVRNCGSIVQVFIESDAAREWINENVGGETSWLGNALCVELRYAEDLLAGMRDAGLVAA